MSAGALAPTLTFCSSLPFFISLALSPSLALFLPLSGSLSLFLYLSRSRILSLSRALHFSAMLLIGNTIFVANLGDTRALISRYLPSDEYNRFL